MKYSPIFRLNWCWLRPQLKRLLPQPAQRLVQHVRSRFQPALVQHRPRPLRLSPYAARPVPATDVLPGIAIVTPSRNQAEFLERTIASVLGQNYPKLEYVIMDGASKDGTERILAQYENWVTYLESKRDSGQAQAINKGFQHTTGDIMAWLNADDLLLPGTLRAIGSFFSTHPDIDVVYGHRICINRQDAEIGRWLVLPDAERVLPWANYIPQETLFWRRRLWEQVGGALNETYQFALDWELLLRFYQAGARFARRPYFFGAFRVHPQQKTSAHEALGMQERQRLHTWYHGRPIEWLEIRYQVRRYLWRTMWMYLFHYLRDLRNW